MQNKIKIQKNVIDQNDIDKKELEFLKLNLIYSSNVKKLFFKKGYKVGTQEYKDCIFREGKKQMIKFQKGGVFFRVYSWLPIIVLYISVLNEFDLNYLNIDHFFFNFPYILIFYFFS